MITDTPFVSVIIPTYNRPESLARTLQSLGGQTVYPNDFEVVVVDDGSRQPYAEVVEQSWPFDLQYHRQDNQGEIIARNLGVSLSRGEFLVFLDDDILVEPAYLESLLAEHLAYPQAILLGALYPKLDLNASVFQRVSATQEVFLKAGEVPFTECYSGVMAMGRTVYQAVGGMRPLGDGGRNAWGGMDFGYRARLAGYVTRRCVAAVAYHNDYAGEDLAVCCQRLGKVARLAVLHFQRCPTIQPFVPMFHDKTPIVWQQDSPRLIARKLARHLMSSPPVLGGMERVVRILEQHFPSPAVLHPLYRWIKGGYIFRGYQQGLREYGQVRAQG